MQFEQFTASIIFFSKRHRQRKELKIVFRDLSSRIRKRISSDVTNIHTICTRTMRETIAAQPGTRLLMKATHAFRRQGIT